MIILCQYFLHVWNNWLIIVLICIAFVFENTWINVYQFKIYNFNTLRLLILKFILTNSTRKFTNDTVNIVLLEIRKIDNIVQTEKLNCSWNKIKIDFYLKRLNEYII